MDLKKAFGTDAELEEHGVWVDIGGGAELLVARIGNETYKKYLSDAMKPHRRAFRTGAAPEELMDQLLVKTLANTILLNWRGVKDDGEEIEYSVEAAEQMLRKYKDFRAIVSEISSEMETFREVDEEDAAKNLERSSDGDSLGEDSTPSS